MQKTSFILGIMKCFSFSSGDRRNEVKTTTKSSSLRSSTSTSTTDHDVRRLDSELNSQNASEISNESSSQRTSFTSLSQRASGNLRSFTFVEMKRATKNFSRSFMIGEGGFGSVFRGTIQCLEDPQKKIITAVKQLSRTGMQGHKEWVTEVSVLGVVEHPNLVKLLGYCADDDERGIQRMLVYEYMPNKSVQDHLSKRHQPSLSWTTRLKIAQDTARGLAYLHEGMEFQIIFRDFKSSNILLDDQWNAKLSDFGLARLGPEHGVSHVSTAVVGTIGYAAPEYVHTGHLTYKSDVWSYGVFLYELITGRCPVDRNRPKDERRLLDWIRPHLSDMKKFRMIIDPKMETNFSLKSVQMLAVVANKCLVRHPKMRPKMSQVLAMVNQIVEMPPQKENEGLSCPKSKGQKLLKRRFVGNLMRENGWLVLRSWRRKVL